MKRITLWVITALSLTACGMFGGDHGAFRNRTTEYKQAQNIPPLKIPPEITTISLSEYYPVPRMEKGYNTAPVDLYPPRIAMPDTSPPPTA